TSIFISMLILVGSPVWAQDRGPFLRELTSKAQMAGLNYFEAVSNYPAPFFKVKFQGASGAVAASFDYVLLAHGEEWFLNFSSKNWKVMGGALEQILLPKQATRSQLYFSKRL